MSATPAYRQLEEIARDAQTRTFRGVGASDAAPVLVKVPLAEYPEPRTIALLRHEFAIARRLEDAGALRVLRLESSRHAYALVYEDSGGETVASLLSRKKLAMTEFLRLALNLARALGEIHRRGVVHNGISSHAILVDAAAGDARFTGFGSASLLEVEFSERWSPDTVPGPLEYISPEQTGRMNRAVDLRSDVYSLGIVLYEMLIGWLPFQSRDPMELVHAHIARRPKSPSELNEDIPMPVSDILLKMLEKSAEQRYQSCAGLVADLETCLSMLETAGSIASFAIGEHDTYERFLLPQKLYGRDRETERTTEAFHRAADGAVRLLMLSGYSGSGKTALVHEMHAPIARRNGCFLSGKFDQLQRNIPYAPLLQAFQQFVGMLLSMDDGALAQWRARIADAVGANGRILLDLLPDIELVLGAQPEVIALPEKEAQNRFHSVLLAFVQAIARPEHPLVVFLDDCQWMDAASFEFIGKLLQHPDSRSLLLLCSYRENEVAPGHPVFRMAENAEKASVAVERVHLAPLLPRDVTALVRDMLHLEDGAGEELGALLHAKTQGNPFFLGEFLRSLHAKRLLRFHREENRWQWSMQDIVRENITDNVAELVLERIHTLPSTAQQVLQLASCLGNRFDLRTLATVREAHAARTAGQLWDAIHAGLVVPIDDSYRLYQYDDELDESPADADDGAQAIEYKFLHDRVQQAAYDSIPAAEKQAMHLRIGRLLHAALPEQRRDDALFDIVHHLNAGADLLTDNAERGALAGRNLRAARKARASAAYEAAYQYASKGLSLLSSTSDPGASPVGRDLLHEAGMCEYLTGRFDDADRHFDEVLRITPDTLAKAAILTSKVTLYCAVPRVDEAIAIAAEGLASLGIRLHTSPGKAQVGLQLARVQWLLRGKSAADLRALPEMTDAASILALELLASMISVAYYRSAEMYALLILKMMELVLRKGVSVSAPFVFSQYSAIIAAGFGRYARAVEFGGLATALLERFPHPLWSGRVKMTIGVFSLNWEKEFSDSLASLRESRALSSQSGDHLYGVWSGRFIVLTRLCTGDTLQEIASDLESALHYSRQVNLPEPAMASVDVFHRSMTVPVADLDARRRLADERAGLERMLGVSTDIPSRMYHASHMIASAWLCRDFTEGAALIAASKPDMHGILGQLSEAWYRFFCVLTLGERRRAGTGGRAAGRAISAHRGKLAALAAHCPANYRHLVDIVDAEAADDGRGSLRALPLHARALASAADFGAPLFIAIANESAGRCFLRSGIPRLALVHLRDAHAAYGAWGASEKTRLLEAEFPDLLTATRETGSRAGDAGLSAHGGGLSAKLDVLSFVKASHAFSDEIILEKLLRKLIRIILENAGAERGLLILERDGAWRVEAEGDSSRRDAAVMQSVPLETYPAIAHSVVHYVERTRQPFALDAAHRRGDFTGDPHIAVNAVASILCIPLIHSARLTGILYMENSLTEGAFPSERLEALTILSADMAISIENARLFADLAFAKTEIEQYSRTLEEKVDARTSDLRRKSEELEKAIEHLHTTQEQLVHAEKLATLGELTAGIAHEIRNPLNFVTNFAEASDELFEDLSHSNDEAERAGILADLRENLARIREHGRKADGILKSMMMHARGSAGNTEESDINLLADEAATVALHMLRASMPDVDVAIERHFSASLPRVRVVPQDLSRVLLNIMQNGIYAATERWKVDGGPPPRLSVSTVPAGTGVAIRIRDNGAGIPEEIRNKIFQPFFTTKPTGYGTGLGLSMSYDIVVKGHGGTLRAENSAEGGAEFILTLPG
ncbi:MAG: AAA family ATPase [Ignavibacteria bacterium]|nr:AAA family ATPase [Ignavibacteria bacterium]